MRISKSDSEASSLASRLLVALLASSMMISVAAAAEEEAAVPADVPASAQELMQQAGDGEVAVPRVRKFVKPDRSLMKAGVLNTKAGIAFMDENQRKPGVVKLKSGLQYKVIKAGSGVKPGDDDVVKCQYRGSLIDGTVFEQSEPGKPSNIKVALLLPGLKEAIKLMPVGSKWEVYIPSELGFGNEGKLPTVGPDAVLIYELNVLGLVPPAAGKR